MSEHSATVSMELTLNDGMVFKIGKSGGGTLYFHQDEEKTNRRIHSYLGILKVTVDGKDSFAAVRIVGRHADGQMVWVDV